MNLIFGYLTATEEIVPPSFSILENIAGFSL
jgi:hypothetical protein